MLSVAFPYYTRYAICANYSHIPYTVYVPSLAVYRWLRNYACQVCTRFRVWILSPPTPFSFDLEVKVVAW